MENRNILEETSELIGTDFAVDIEDGVMRITPAEAGIAIFAYMSQAGTAADGAWSAVDEQIEQVMALREENALLRHALENFRELLETAGYSAQAGHILALLWPVVGVLADGTEVPVAIDWSAVEVEGL